MDSYITKLETVTIENNSFEILSLKDKKQFYDPDEEAAELGISCSMWPISGLIWPSGLVLAKIIDSLETENKRILEVGCGIAIASFVAAAKNADITASDYHPLVETLLEANADANKIDGLKYVNGDWRKPISNIGRFDLIIGSDLLYEKEHANLLAIFIDCHLNENGKAIIIDPGRRAAKKIRGAMKKLGYTCTQESINKDGVLQKGGKFDKYVFGRDAVITDSQSLA